MSNTKETQQEPDDYVALLNRGVEYFNKGNYEKAIEDFSAVIKINPDYGDVLIIRGNTYKIKGDYDKAIEDFSVAIKIGSWPRTKVLHERRFQDLWDYSALIKRGLTYFYKNNHNKAIEDFSAAIKIKPDYKNALFYREFTAYAIKDNLETKAALEIDPNNVNARETLEEIRQRKAGIKK